MLAKEEDHHLLRELQEPRELELSFVVGVELRLLPVLELLAALFDDRAPCGRTGAALPLVLLAEPSQPEQLPELQQEEAPTGRIPLAC